jgi:chromosome condensin MukBEF MukE localization factor
MENELEKTSDFRFLEEEGVAKYFADLNIKLLSGRHIELKDYAVFSVLEDYFGPLKNFYLQLYKLDLVRKVFDQSVYYYLNFFDAGRGKLSDPSRYRPITEIQTIVGLMLLDMYFVRYFDPEKKVFWSAIRDEVQSGDQKVPLQRLLFPEVRVEYSEPEWQSAERRFRTTIQKFNDLGWVTQLSSTNEELCFVINPSTHRIAELYETELQDFDAFSLKFKTGRAQ